MQTLAQILAGIPANPYDNQSQGIAPLLQQHMMAAQNPGMQQMPPSMEQGAPGQGAPGAGGLPPELLRQLLLRQQQQQQQQQPGLGSMGDAVPPMQGGYSPL